MKAAIISTGEELLTGETTDTNSAWLAEKLWAEGIDVHCMLTVGDHLSGLVWALEQACLEASLVLMTGGLGPTVDDRTAEAVAEWSNDTLVLNDEALQQIEARYRARGRTVNNANRKQAWLPSKARVLENRWGSAPGFEVLQGDVRVICLPGVPVEMKRMFAAHFTTSIPNDARPKLVRMRTFGCAESRLSEILEAVDLGSATLGFRAHIPEVQVKLRFPEHTLDCDVSKVVERTAQVLSPWTYNVDGGDLAETVISELMTEGETVCLAESCTAGMTAAWLADVPGSSAVLDRGFVTYSNESKIDLLGVSADTLAHHGAVSEAVAREMAHGARAMAKSTWGLSLTGIAGPGGGSDAKPVGTVHIAVAGPNGVVHQHAVIPGSRGQVRKRAAGAVLSLLLRTRRT